MKKVLIIIGTIIVFIILLGAFFLFRIDITRDDIRDILERVETIDICYNLSQDNDKLLECTDKNNALVLSLDKEHTLYKKVYDMYDGMKEKKLYERSFVATTKEKRNYMYKVVFKDSKGNPLMGATLGCDQSYFKIDDTYYVMDPGANCSKVDVINTYLENHNSSHESATEEFNDRLSRRR